MRSHFPAALLVFGLIGLLPRPAAAQTKHVVRIATAVPRGTLWARAIGSYQHQVAAATAGQVTLKVYFDGIAGGEREALARVQSGQLDGMISGGAVCEQISPILKVSRIPGLYRNWREASFIVNGLHSVVESQARDAGFMNVGSVVLGAMTVFTDRPVGSLQALDRQRIGMWDLDVAGQMIDRALGLRIVPIPIEQAGQHFDDQVIDAFLTVPVAALAFQMTAHVKYVLDLEVGYATGCVLISNRAFDRLTEDEQNVVRSATAVLYARLDDAGRQQEAELMGRVLLRKQGLTRIELPPSMRSRWEAMVRRARGQLAGRLVDGNVLAKVEEGLAEYRQTHRAP